MRVKGHTTVWREFASLYLFAEVLVEAPRLRVLRTIPYALYQSREGNCKVDI